MKAVITIAGVLLLTLMAVMPAPVEAARRCMGVYFADVVMERQPGFGNYNPENEQAITIRVPVGGIVRGIKMASQLTIVLFVEYDPAAFTADRTLYIFKTGHEFNNTNLRYVATFSMGRGQRTAFFHAFERHS